MRKKPPEHNPVYVIKASPTLHVYVSVAGGVTLLDHWPNGHPRAIENYTLERFRELVNNPTLTEVKV